MSARFEGEFVPPRMGGSAVPIQIAGRGSLLLEEGRLVADGFKRRDTSMLIVAAILGIIVLTVVLQVGLGLSQTLSVSIAVGLASGVSVFLRSKKNASKEAPRLQLAYQREHVKSAKKFNANPSGDASTSCVLIQIRGAKPKGDIYFRPDEGVDKLLAALATFSASQG